MILYFTGTGNSRYLASVLKDQLNDEVVSINDLIKNQVNKTFFSQKPYIFITPIYFGRIPKIVADFILCYTFEGSNKVYFISSYYSGPYDTQKYNKELSQKKNFEYMGTYTIQMPQGHIVLTNCSNEGEAKSIIASSTEKVLKEIEKIKTLSPFLEEKTKGKIVSNLVNPLFYTFIAKSKDFKANDKCIACAKCVSLCPLNNISIVNSLPLWGNNCTHCMACINSCPKEAINYGNKTVKRIRYYNDSTYNHAQEESM
ncbi:MAG: flavodoxin [Bacillales bacterium]|nr:flavodoxin [Bacillales bacterium]